MTCIVGLVDGAGVLIGGDSMAHAGCQRYPATPLEGKVVKRAEMVFGSTGPTRLAQILAHVLVIPEHPDGMDTYPYLVKHLMPALHTTIGEQGGLKINDASDGWEILLGYRRGLYEICHDLSVSHLPEYGAVGCGHMIALGSLYSTTGEYPADRVRIALEAAAAHDIHVAPPFIVESIG